jgi:hypothetical protein
VRRALGAAALAGTLALAAVAPAHADAPATRTAVAFGLTGVGPSGRSIGVRFGYGGCQGAPRASAVETSASVRLSVTVRDVADPLVACPAIARIGRRVVTLRAALRGRRILGWTAMASEPTSRCPGAIGVPRVLGMASADARRLLDGLGLRPSASTGGEVVGQRPAPWSSAPHAGAVQLAIARRAPAR